MTLRLPFRLQQLLFALAGSAGLIGGAQAQDYILLQDGTQRTGRVMGASAAGVQIQIAEGQSITLPASAIKEMRLEKTPPEFAEAQKAFEEKKYDEALKALKSLEKYKGLPTDWAQQAAGMLGDLYVEKGDMGKAEAAYKDFQKFYPGAQGSAQSEIGLARLAVAKKDFAGAKGKLEGIAGQAAQDKNVTRVSGYAYSQGFYLLGQVKESEGDFAAALKNYLKTTTLFYFDRTAVVLAQEKADAIRKAHPEIFIP